MKDHLAKRTSRKLKVGEYADWVKRFDVEEYLGNRPMIEKLYEEKQLALVDAFDFEERLDAVLAAQQRLELDNQGLRQRLADAQRRSSVAFCLSLISVILIGLGISLSTGSASKEIGWALVTIGVGVELVAYFMKPRASND